VNRIFRRFIAGLSVIGGLFVIYFELTHSQGGESWFWILVAGFAAMLGMVELMSKDKPRPPDLPLDGS
jgi:hypothetical protein